MEGSCCRVTCGPGLQSSPLQGLQLGTQPKEESLRRGQTALVEDLGKRIKAKSLPEVTGSLMDVLLPRCLHSSELCVPWDTSSTCAVSPKKCL